MRRVLTRPLAYLWASPNTVVGLLFLGPALATGGRARVRRGAVEIRGGFVRVFLRHLLPIRANGMCLGHVILGQDDGCLDHCRDHEHVHVRQCERWGPLFLPANSASSAAAWWRGKNPYFDNRFEREAYSLFP